MRSANNAILRFLIILLATATAAEASPADAKTADELIKEAQKYDYLYNLGPDASREKALGYYKKALDAKPLESERLHVLFRMAQLHGCVFRAEKGEEPDFRKAIELYEEIVDSYPSYEPKVITAIGLISDHYTSLGDFEKAIEWAKKVFESDMGDVDKQVKTVEEKIRWLAEGEYTLEERESIQSQAIRLQYLKNSKGKIKRDKVRGVDRVARSALLIDPLRAHGELRAIASKHADTAIGKRAVELLAESMDKWPNLWAPDGDLPFSSNDSALQADIPGAPGLNQKQSEFGTKSGLESVLGPPKGLESIEPNSAEKLQRDDFGTKSSRAPPLGKLTVPIVSIAGLAVLCLAMVLRRGISTKGLEK